MEQVDIQIKRIEEAYKTTTLPNKPNTDVIEQIVIKIIENIF